MLNPTVFIGSSTEQLPTARAVEECLRPFAKATVWDNAEFALNESIFDGLLRAAHLADYAVFVFDPDDVTNIRGRDSRTVRDNVLFEFGLFIGRMGKGRTFWISARSSAGHHLPTDLIGITHLSFTAPTEHTHEALVSAVGEPSERLRKVILKQGRRDDRVVEELDTVNILCVASAEYDEPKFADDITHLRQSFPPGSITSAHGVSGAKLYEFCAQRTWDIVHLAMYVDPRNGDLIVPDPHEATTRSVIPIDGVDKLITIAKARLVVVVTCDSLVLAARLARHTNTIAGHQPINVRSALNWSAVFYPALAQGCPLSEAFNRAQTLADPGLVLISRRDFRLTLRSGDSLDPVATI